MKKCYATTIPALLIGAVLMACATKEVARVPVIPGPLAVSANQALWRVLRANGVQIYECKASQNDPTRLEWTFKAPAAELRDSKGTIVGRHYAGPTWEANDGSKVVGEVTARDNGPDPDAIPWLLLRATSTSGPGALSRTTSIQRLNTWGGEAPASACDSEQAGQEARVPYRADYFFYTRRP
jgi:hypothetical protein